MNPSDLPYDPYSYTRRISNETGNLGNHHVPVVVADLSTVEFIKPSHFFGFGYNYSVTLDKWNLSDSAADLVYIGKQMLDFEVPGTLTVMVDYAAWHLNYRNKPGYYPLLGIEDLESFDSDDLIFIKHTAENEDVLYLLDYPNAVIVLKTEYSNKTQLFRYSHLNFATNEINNPVILCSSPATEDPEKYQLWSSSDIGSVLIDGLPIIFSSFPWWGTVVCFVLMHFVAGLTLAAIFQPAHVVPTSAFQTPNHEGNIELDWATNQLMNTANFAPKSRFFSWCVGGLNYQIEHHLFPNICHVHYRKISNIVRDTAFEYNLPYYSYNSFYSALYGHAKMLYRLGKEQNAPAIH